MPAEEDMVVVKTFVEEVINSGNLEKVDELVAPDHVNNDPIPSGTLSFFLTFS